MRTTPQKSNHPSVSIREARIKSANEHEIKPKRGVSQRTNELAEPKRVALRYVDEQRKRPVAEPKPSFKERKANEIAKKPLKDKRYSTKNEPIIIEKEIEQVDEIIPVQQYRPTNFEELPQ